MPLYDFKCGGCGTLRVDVLQSYSAPPPTCCDAPMTRQPSAAAFRIFGHSQANGYSCEVPTIGNVGTQREVKVPYPNMKVQVTQR